MSRNTSNRKQNLKQEMESCFQIKFDQEDSISTIVENRK